MLLKSLYSVSFSSIYTYAHCQIKIARTDQSAAAAIHHALPHTVKNVFLFSVLSGKYTCKNEKKNEILSEDIFERMFLNVSDKLRSKTLPLTSSTFVK